MTVSTDAASPGGTPWRRADGALRLFWRLFLGWFAFVAALVLVSLLSAALHQSTGLGHAWVDSAILTGIAVPAIVLLRRYGDRGTLAGIGLSARPAHIALMFVFMIGVILLAAGVLAICAATGAVRIVSFNFTADAVPFVAATLAYVFFYEALPEEMTFRGYLYTNLNTVLPRWLALPGQVALFVLAPVTAGFVVTGLFGQEMTFSGAGHVTFEYVLVLVIFGCALQLSRIVTGSLWAGVGFHLGFISLSRFVFGAGERALIRVEDIDPRTTQEVVIFLGALVGGTLLLLLWSFLRGKQTGWNARAPDGA